MLYWDKSSMYYINGSVHEKKANGGSFFNTYLLLDKMGL